jgi:hypothetical protein
MLGVKVNEKTKLIFVDKNVAPSQKLFPWYILLNYIFPVEAGHTSRAV